MAQRLTLEDYLTKQQLRRKYLSCRHSQEKKRWQALCLIADGGVAAHVADQLGMSRNWISQTVHRYNTGGVVGVKNKSKNEGSKTLTAEQVKELEKESRADAPSGGRLWSSTEIKRWCRCSDGRRYTQNNGVADVRQVGLYPTSSASCPRGAGKRASATEFKKT